MKNRILHILIFLILSQGLIASSSGDTLNIEVEGLTLEGTLLVPETDKAMPLVLFISGSGPTDRNGNQKTMQNNSLKMLAEGLRENGIASLRYDKRNCNPEYVKSIKEEDISFEHFVDDAVAWVNHLNNDSRFEEIIVLGHSQGSLIGILSAQRSKVSKLISLCGPGKEIGESLMRQLKAQGLKEIDKVQAVITSLENGETTDDYPRYLVSLFRPSVQPFLISWMKYHPGEEVKKLNIPIAVIHGSSDSQISEDESQALADAVEGTEMVTLTGMNHVLKNVGDDFFANRNSYNDPNKPLHEDLLNVVVEFIKK